MQDYLCELKGIYKDYAVTLALKNVDFHVNRREICALLGKNGAGKSTLIKIISGAISPTKGEMYFKGKKVNVFNTKNAFEQGISVLYQELHLLPNLTVKENIFAGRLPIKNGMVNYRQMEEEAQRILESLHINIDPDKSVAELSTVEKQLVSVATAISRKAELFVFDEPSSILSMKELQIFYKSIRKLKEMDKGIIYVTHSLEEIPVIADRVVVLRDGVKVVDDSLENMKIDDIEASITGKSKKDKIRKKEIAIAEKGRLKVELKNICFRNLLEDINLKFYENLVYCVYGLEGSGKRILGKILFGDLKPTKGIIKISGKLVRINSPSDGIHNGVGYMVDERANEGLLLNKNISDNIILPCFERVTGKFFLDSKKINKLVDKRIDEIGIFPPKASIMVNELSGGNQQKVLLGKWLEIGFILVLVDPTRGLDIETNRKVIELIRRFRTGRVTIVIPSEIEDGLAMSDWIVILRDGKVMKNEEITPKTNKRELLKLAGLEF